MFMKLKYGMDTTEPQRRRTIEKALPKINRYEAKSKFFHDQTDLQMTVMYLGVCMRLYTCPTKGNEI